MWTDGLGGALFKESLGVGVWSSWQWEEAGVHL